MKKDVFEELIVVKRSGQRVSFNSYKIAVAIKQAFDYVYETYNEKNVNKVYEDVLEYIEKNYSGRKTINVEDIQDIIENKLKEEKHIEVFNAFSEYRQKRAASRKVFTIKQQHKFVKAMEKITEDNSLRSDNDYKPNEVLIRYGRTVVNEFSKSYLIDSKYLRAHEEGNIYVHDMELFPLGVLSSVHLNLKNSLEKTDSIDSLLLNIIKVKQEIKGEINLPALDFLLEDWTIKRYKSFFKEYIINYLRVTGFYEYINSKKILELIDREIELEINLTKYNSFIYSEQVGNIFKRAYEDAVNKTKEVLVRSLTRLFTTLDEEQNYSLSLGTNNSKAGELINLMIFETLKNLVPLKNLKIILKVKKKEDKYLILISELLEIGSEVIISFVDNSFNNDVSEIEYFSDGIRLFENVNSGYRESNGRMVVAKTSLNISRLGLKYKERSVKEFYSELEENLELAKNNLLLSFETIGNKNKENYEILFNNNILDDEKLEVSQKIRKVIKNGTLLIGIVGLKECIISLCPDESKQMLLIIEIMKFLNKKCSEFEQDTKLNFDIYEPYEIKVRKEFMALDKAIYGINKNITEASRYDLISNLPVIKNDYKKQGLLQRLFTGGNMFEINLPANASVKKILELINDLIVSDVGIAKIKLGKKGD